MPRNLPILLFSIFSTVWLIGCDRPDKSSDYLATLLNESVRVQIRRDALGRGAGSPMPMNTDAINGVSTSIVGKLVAQETNAIIVVIDGKTKWIPRDVILSIESE